MSADHSRKRLIVVLGMHRCGTSLLANLLNVLGVDLGKNLVEPDAWNQAGYWELKEIYRTQDEVLARLGRPWTQVEGTLPFPSEWWRNPELYSLKQRLLSIVRAEMDPARSVWGFKDPRTASLLPLWQEIFAELKVEPTYLLAVRHPLAVVASLMKRNHFTSHHAQLLWLLTNLDTLRYTRGQLRLVVDYDRWFTHPLEQARAVLKALELPEPVGEERLAAAVQVVVKPDLRHSLAEQNDEPLPYTLETYALLQQAAAESRIPDELWQIEGAVRQAQKLLLPPTLRPASAPQATVPKAPTVLSNWITIQHAPAQLGLEERHMLFSLVFALKPQRVLEIGTFRGGSAQIIVAALDQVKNGVLICVDPTPEITTDWRTIAHRATLLQKPSPQALAEACDLAGGEFDFCFIDGWHVYTQVLADTLGVLAHMAAGGHILFHDAYQPHVREAIDDLTANLPFLSDCGIISRSRNDAPGGPFAGLRLIRVLPQPASAGSNEHDSEATLPWQLKVSDAASKDLRRAEALIQQNRHAEARTQLNLIMHSEPAPDVLNDWAIAEMMDGRAGSALLLLWKVLQVDPQHQVAHENLGYLQQQLPSESTPA